MALRESGEDYLESIYVLSERQGVVRSIDVAEYLGVTKASVSKAMAALESTGYVEMGKRDVHLTERGLEVARQMWERHCFFVGLLEDAGVAPEVASQEGCHMEHCLSEESFEKLRLMLGRDEMTDPTPGAQRIRSNAPFAQSANQRKGDRGFEQQRVRRSPKWSNWCATPPQLSYLFIPKEARDSDWDQ